MRALDLYGYARQAVAYQTDDARAALEAYADGVNAWLKVVQTRRARPRGAGVLPLLAGHLALDAGQFDRGAEAHGAADDRQGGDGDAARRGSRSRCRRSGCATSCRIRPTRR